MKKVDLINESNSAEIWPHHVGGVQGGVGGAYFSVEEE